MALNRKTESSQTGDYENMERGEYDARLVYVADLGMHQDEYKGELKSKAQKISLGLEVVGHTVQIDGEQKPRYLWVAPFNIFSTLTEKGNELKYYSVFEPSATAGEVPDWDSQLGKACSIFVDQNEKGYDGITNITAIPSKYQQDIAPATIEGGVGDGEAIENALFGLAKWTFDKALGEEEEDS